jgi:hypothetical protein
MFVQLATVVFASLIHPSLGHPSLSPMHGSNLIVNGDFSAGNTGFTSQYTFASPITAEGQYTIGTDPCMDAPPNYVWACFGDHTTGSGNMFMADGYPSTPGVIVWSETITVNPMTTYKFGFWGAGVDTQGNSSPAVLQILFNNVASRRLATIPTVWTTWVHYHASWKSHSATQVTISLVDTNTAGPYNDFALDDLSFKAAPAGMQSRLDD